MPWNCFACLKESELEPRTYSSVLQLCAGLKSLTYGKKAHSIVNSNNVVLLGSKLVSFYAIYGYLKEPKRFLIVLKKKNVNLWNFMVNANSVFSSIAVKDINYWNTMIQGYLKNCFPNKALKMFVAMLKQLKPDK
ncbi:hypothetical protein GQ457_05G027540 [Hibiscus cannabinus]